MTYLFPQQDSSTYRCSKPKAIRGGFPWLMHSDESRDVAVRNLLEEWFSAYPDSPEKDELRSKFHSAGYTWMPQFTELAVHEMCRRLQCPAQPIPHEEGSGKRADYRVTCGAGHTALLEVATVTLHPREEWPRRRQQIELVEKLDACDAKGWAFSLEVKRFGTQMPSQGAVQRALSKRIDYFEQNQRWSDPRDPATWDRTDLALIEINDWLLALYAQPYPDALHDDFDRSVIRWTSETGDVDAADRIRNVFKRKPPAEYQAGAEPLILAINSLAVGSRLDSFIDAIYGTRYIAAEVKDSEIVDTRWARHPDGTWLKRTGWAGSGYSAILAIWDMQPYALEHAGMALIHHPSPLVRLDGLFDQVPQVYLQEDTLQDTTGVTPSDLLEIPSGWPREVDANSSA